MRNVVAYGSIKRNGNKADLSVAGKIAFNAQLIDMILNGRDECKVVITISENSEPKTNQQLKYYFGVVIPYCQLGFKALGWLLDKGRTDFELRMMFHKEEVPNTATGEIKSYPASLSKCSKESLSEFIESVIRFASEELGVAIPPPGETAKSL